MYLLVQCKTVNSSRLTYLFNLGCNVLNPRTVWLGLSLRSKRVAVGWVFLTCKRCHIFNVTPPTPPLSQTSKMKQGSLHT